MGLKKQARVVPGKSKTGIRVYNFPDRLSHCDPDESLMVGMDIVVAELLSPSAFHITAKGINRFKQSILQLSLAHETLRTTRPHPTIVKLLKELEEVSDTRPECVNIYIIGPTLFFLQALMTNSKHLQQMEEAASDEEIDIYDPKYDVASTKTPTKVRMTPRVS